MNQRTRWVCGVALVAAAFRLATVGAQSTPVATMYEDDQKKATLLPGSFATQDLPASGAATSPLHVYLSAGDLERAYDTEKYRPDAAIVPTNTELALSAPFPSSQRVLMDRVRKQADVWKDLEEQAVTRRRELTGGSGGEAGKLQVGVDAFMAMLPRSGGAPSGSAFPKSVCMVATDFPQGGAVDRRELFAQDRVRKGIAACLAALDAAGAQSVMMPLMGASSRKAQTKDRDLEGPRLLKECRLINSVAGLALGVHDFAASRRHIREIGIVQWDREITDMFGLPGLGKLGPSAYKIYAEQVSTAWGKGLSGEKTTPADVAGSCRPTLNAK